MVRATLSSEQSQHRKFVTKTAQKSLTSWILLLKIHIFTITDKGWWASHRNALAIANLPTVAPNPWPSPFFSLAWNTRLPPPPRPLRVLQLPTPVRPHAGQPQAAGPGCDTRLSPAPPAASSFSSSRAFRVRHCSEPTSKPAGQFPTLTGEAISRGPESTPLTRELKQGSFW